MSLGGWQRVRANDQSAHEMEALQTDVMRFMALLGFCLMAIFALVQSLPPGDTDAASTEQQRRQLEQQVGQLQQQADELRGELSLRRQQLSQVQAQEDAADQDIQQTQSSLQDARLRFEQQHSRDARIAQKIQQREQSLAELEQALAQKQETLQAAARRSSNADTARVAAQQPRQTTPAEKPAKKSEERIPGQTIPAKEINVVTDAGFQLRFASSEVLTNLINNGSVRFYAVSGRRVWRYRAGRESPRFVLSASPEQFYEMEAPTVPEAYPRILARALTQDTLANVTWGVTLPEVIRADIARLTREHNGGELFIQTNGSVIRREQQS